MIDRLIQICTQPFVLGGVVAPLVVIAISSVLRAFRGVKLSAFADVIGVLLCVDIAAIAAPEGLAGLIASSSPTNVVTNHHLFLLLVDLFGWIIALTVFEPIILNERRRSGTRGPFVPRGWSGGARTGAWILSAAIAWVLVWFHFRVWASGN